MNSGLADGLLYRRLRPPAVQSFAGMALRHFYDPVLAARLAGRLGVLISLRGRSLNFP